MIYKKSNTTYTFLFLLTFASSAQASFSNTPLSSLDQQLLEAATNNDTKTIKLLLEQDANINAKGESDYNPLIFATENNAIEAVELLLKNGVKVNNTTRCNETALHRAATNNFSQIAAMLIANGANIYIKDSCGRTALQEAINEKSQDVIALLAAKEAADKEAAYKETADKDEIVQFQKYYSNPFYTQAMKILQRELGDDFTKVVRYDASTNCIVVGSSAHKGQYDLYTMEEQELLVNGMTSEQVKALRANK